MCRLQSLDLSIKNLSWEEEVTVFAIGPSTSISVFL